VPRPTHGEVVEPSPEQDSEAQTQGRFHALGQPHVLGRLLVSSDLDFETKATEPVRSRLRTRQLMPAYPAWAHRQPSKHSLASDRMLRLFDGTGEVLAPGSGSRALLVDQLVPWRESAVDLTRGRPAGARTANLTAF
jgi:hypothetical protein